MIITYLGPSNVRQITSADFLAEGLSSPTLRWQQSNGYSIDVPPEIGAFLLAQGEFVSEPPATFGDVIEGGPHSHPEYTTDAEAVVIAQAQAASAVAAVLDSAPAVLDTLNELANALGDDPNFATTMTNQLATKAADNAVVKLTGAQSISGVKTFTSSPVVPTPTTGGQAAPKSYVDGLASGGGSAPDGFVDVWNSQSNPGSVTDWQVKIIALLDAGYRHLWISRELPCTGMLDLTDRVAITLEGPAGLPWIAINGDLMPGRLLYTGGGSGDFVRLHGSRGVTLKNLGIHYNNAAFTGRVVNARNGTNCPCGGLVIDSCIIGPKSLPALNAMASLAMGVTVGCVVRNSTLWGSQYALRCFDLAGDNVSNANTYDHCAFVGFTHAAVVNPGLQTWFINCTWEFNDSALDARGIDTDISCFCQFTVKGGGFWDVNIGSPNTQIPIRCGNTSEWIGATFENIYFDIFSGAAAYLDLIGFGNHQWISILRNCFAASIPSQSTTLVDLHSSAPYAKNVRWEGNRVVVNAPTTLVANTAGHFYIDGDASGGTGLSDHLADTIDAHDASAISFVPAGTIAATNVQAAIEEVAAEASGGGGTTFDLNPFGTRGSYAFTPHITTTSRAAEVGRAWWGPIWVGLVANSFYQFAVELSGAASAGTAEYLLAVYANNAGQPGAKIAGTDINLTGTPVTSTGFKTMQFAAPLTPVSLPAGWVWGLILLKTGAGTSPQYLHALNLAVPSGGSSNISVNLNGWFQDGLAAVPSDGSGASQAPSCPVIGLRRP